MANEIVENTHGVSIKFTPWEEKRFKIDLLHIWEAVSGKQPGGIIELTHDGNQEALDFITEQQTGIIKIVDGGKDGGQSYSFGVFIVDRKIYNNQVELSFTIIPQDDLMAGKDFYTRPRSMKYDTLEEAVNSVWPGKKENPVIKGVEAEGSTAKEVWQDNETGYDFLSRLCFSWKFKSVYAFSWDGLVIKDISGDSDIEFTTGGHWTQTNRTTMKYDSRHNNELFNPWQDENKDSDESISKSTTGEIDFKDKEPQFVSSSISRDSYKIHAKGYDASEKNLKKNSEFRGYTVVTACAQEMPSDWKIGDVVNYKRIDPSNSDKTEKDIRTAKYVVAGNEFFIAQNGATKTGPNGFDFEWTVTLWGLEELDVNKEIQNNKNNNE